MTYNKGQKLARHIIEKQKKLCENIGIEYRGFGIELLLLMGLSDEEIDKVLKK